MIQTEKKLPCAYLGSKAEELIALKSANTMYNHPNPDSQMNCWNFGVCATLPLLRSYLLHTTHTIDDRIYKTGKKALNNNNKNPPIWNGQPQGKKKTPWSNREIKDLINSSNITSLKKDQKGHVSKVHHDYTRGMLKN